MRMVGGYKTAKALHYPLILNSQKDGTRLRLVEDSLSVCVVNGMAIACGH